MLGKQSESKVKFLIWAEKNKGVALAKGFSLNLTEIRDMPNKCEDPYDMKSTTDEEKASVKAVNKKHFSYSVPLSGSGHTLCEIHVMGMG